jgi:hypothetical protein
MIQQLTEFFADIRLLVLAGAGVFLLVATISIGLMRRSLLSAAGVFVFGTLLLWGMYNSDWMRDRWGDDFQGAPPGVSVSADGAQAAP